MGEFVWKISEEEQRSIRPLENSRPNRALSSSRGSARYITLRLAGTVLALSTYATSPRNVYAGGETNQNNCQFVLGFKTLHDLDSNDIGDCLDNQSFAANGDSQQHTTKGLMAWRKADNWTAFTNGYRTWINGPTGLVSRLNTERFPWEAGLANAPATTGNGGGLKEVAPTPMTPEQAIQDINIKYPEASFPGRANFIRQLFRDGRSVFPQLNAKTDGNYDSWYSANFGGRMPAQVRAQSGTLDQAIAGVDYVGPPAPGDNLLRCTIACAQTQTDRSNKFGSIGTQEDFFNLKVQNARPEYIRAYQIFAMIKEALDNMYRKAAGSTQAAETLSNADIADFLEANINTGTSVFGLTIDEMKALNGAFRPASLSTTCC